jgi:hypothetical protein
VHCGSVPEEVVSDLAFFGPFAEHALANKRDNCKCIQSTTTRSREVYQAVTQVEKLKIPALLL